MKKRSRYELAMLCTDLMLDKQEQNAEIADLQQRLETCRFDNAAMANELAIPSNKQAAEEATELVELREVCNTLRTSLAERSQLTVEMANRYNAERELNVAFQKDLTQKSEELAKADELRQNYETLQMRHSELQIIAYQAALDLLEIIHDHGEKMQKDDARYNERKMQTFLNHSDMVSNFVSQETKDKTT